MKKLIYSLAFSAALSGCGGSGSGTSTSTSSNAIVSSYSNIQTAMNNFNNLGSSSSKVLSPVYMKQYRPNASFSSLWTTSNNNFIDERDNSATEPYNWFNLQFDADAVRENGSKASMMGRFSSALQTYCAIGVLYDGATDSDGYPNPENGTDELEFTEGKISELVSTCDYTEGELTSMVGVTIQILVESTTSTSTYIKKLTMTLPAEIGGGSQSFFVKSDSTAGVQNVATTEVNVRGVNTTIVNIDSSAIRAEYISGPDGSLGSDNLEIHRGFLDRSSNKIYAMSLRYNYTEAVEDNPDTGDVDESQPAVEGYKAFIAAAQCADDMCESTLGDTSFSFQTKNTNNFTDDTLYEACVSKDDSSSLTTDGSRCSASSTTNNGLDISDAFDSTSGALRTMNYSNWDGDLYDSVGESTALSFDSSDFATSAFSSDGSSTK